MNRGLITAYLVLAMWVVLIGTEIVRSIVDRRRVRRDGLGGTQDILLTGLAIVVVLLIAAGVNSILWFVDK